MPARSAGILIHRRLNGITEVLLVHPGGPFWRGKEQGAWQIPKRLFNASETPEAAARREAEEELGVSLDGPLYALGTVNQPGGKRVEVFAMQGNVDAASVHSNSFEVEWPPGSGRRATFPEIEAARWMPLDAAREAMLPSQREVLVRLAPFLDAT
jgi:predicted NUDIX family NTP pyrophosphohydrolase